MKMVKAKEILKVIIFASVGVLLLGCPAPADRLFQENYPALCSTADDCTVYFVSECSCELINVSQSELDRILEEESATIYNCSETQPTCIPSAFDYESECFEGACRARPCFDDGECGEYL